MKTCAILVAVVLALAGVAHAQEGQILHIFGHAWETGGFPASDPGDNLSVVGIMSDVYEPLIWDESNHSYTFWIRDLVSLGETVSGLTRIAEYTGGLFTIYVDSLPSNHDYGINPPNATAPSTFTDGTSVYLEGHFTDFTLTFNDAVGGGSFLGGLTLTGGDVLALLPSVDLYLYVGIVQFLSPEGYDLIMDGDVFATVFVAVEETSWGGIKSLYR